MICLSLDGEQDFNHVFIQYFLIIIIIIILIYVSIKFEFNNRCDLKKIKETSEYEVFLTKTRRHFEFIIKKKGFVYDNLNRFYNFFKFTCK